MKIKWWGKPTIKTTILEQKLASPDPSLDLSHLSIEELHQRSPGRLESPRLIAGLQSQHNRPRTLEELLRLSSDEGCGLEFDQLSTQPETTARFRRSDNRKPAYYEQFFKSLLSKTLTKSEELPNTKTITEVTFQKVDITANEDCDVDVEEDIPFVAPELLWGIKEMLARVEIQNLRNKQNGHSEKPAQRELGHHYSQFMRAIGHLEQQTNRGFDWLSMLKQDSTKTGTTPNAAGDLQLAQLFSKFKFEPEMSIPAEHPLAKRKTGRSIGMMPSAVRVGKPGVDSPPRSPPLDKAALKQINRMDREVFDEVKKDARDLADEFNLDDMSFAA